MSTSNSSLNVLVIAGGLSLERDVSLRSGTRVAAALDSMGHKVTLLDIDAQVLDRLGEVNPDVAYIALHGRMGEDGTVQGLLELLDVPFTGPDARACAVSWDKAIAKGVWRRRGLLTPDWISLSSDAIRDLGAARILPQIVTHLQMPLVVKPSQGGASMGVGYVTDAHQLTDALIGAFRYHPVALIERFIAGTEIAISIVDGEPLPAVEIELPDDGRMDRHYDFAARYTPGGVVLHTPARLPAEILSAATDVAMAAYEECGARHVTRADMIVDHDGRPWLLELDTSPGMTETSLLPAAAEAAGTTFAAICDRVVRAAVTQE